MCEFLWERSGNLRPRATALQAEEETHGVLAVLLPGTALEDRGRLRYAQRTSASREFFSAFGQRLPGALRENPSWVSDHGSVMRCLSFCVHGPSF